MDEPRNLKRGRGVTNNSAWAIDGENPEHAYASDGLLLLCEADGGERARESQTLAAQTAETMGKRTATRLQNGGDPCEVLEELLDDAWEAGLRHREPGRGGRARVTLTAMLVTPHGLITARLGDCPGWIAGADGKVTETGAGAGCRNGEERRAWGLGPDADGTVTSPLHYVPLKEGDVVIAGTRDTARIEMDRIRRIARTAPYAAAAARAARMAADKAAGTDYARAENAKTLAAAMRAGGDSASTAPWTGETDGAEDWFETGRSLGEPGAAKRGNEITGTTPELGDWTPQTLYRNGKVVCKGPLGLENRAVEIEVERNGRTFRLVQNRRDELARALVRAVGEDDGLTALMLHARDGFLKPIRTERWRIRERDLRRRLRRARLTVEKYAGAAPAGGAETAEGTQGAQPAPA